jgi:DNA-binding CsgD family transcriptional regulator
MNKTSKLNSEAFKKDRKTIEPLLLDVLDQLKQNKIVSVMIISQKASSHVVCPFQISGSVPESRTQKLTSLFREISQSQPYQREQLAANEAANENVLQGSFSVEETERLYAFLKDPHAGFLLLESDGGCSDNNIGVVRVFGPSNQTSIFVYEISNSEVLDSTIERIRWLSQKTYLEICKQKSAYIQSFSFTKRERQIIKAISQGHANPEISRLLNLSVHTVNGYLRNIYLKSQTSDRVSLSFKAMEMGIL